MGQPAADEVQQMRPVSTAPISLNPTKRVRQAAAATWPAVTRFDRIFHRLQSGHRGAVPVASGGARRRAPRSTIAVALFTTCD